MRNAGSHLDFDLTLAAQQSNDNPVYYVQYAHARICSIIRLLADDGITVKPYADINTSLLTDETELVLLKKLADLPEEIRAAAESLEPARITRILRYGNLQRIFIRSITLAASRARTRN